MCCTDGLVVGWFSKGSSNRSSVCGNASVMPGILMLVLLSTNGNTCS